MGFLSSVMIMPINTYSPTLIQALGYGGYRANGMNSVGNVVCLVVTLGLAWSSDRSRERGLHVSAGYALAGFVGSNVFRKEDAPRQQRGLLVCAGCTLSAVVVCLVWMVFYGGDSRARKRI